MAKIVFSNNPEGGGDWKPLPKGTYNMEVESVDADRVTSNGNPQVMVKATVVDGPHAGDKATHFFVLTPKSSWSLMEFCLACGLQLQVTGKDDEGNDIYEGPDTDELLGRQFTVDAALRTYEGKEGNNFTKYRLLGTKYAPKPKSTGAQAPGGPAQGFAPPQGFAAPQGAPPQGFAPPQGYPQPMPTQGYPQPQPGQAPAQYPPQGGFAPPAGYPGMPPQGAFPQPAPQQHPPQGWQGQSAPQQQAGQPPAGWGQQPPPDRRERG